MSAIWSAIDVAGSGATVDQTWIDAIGSNVANMNDAVAPGKDTYQAQYVDAGETVEPAGANGQSTGDGVTIEGIELGPAKGELEYDPTNPLADASGEVAVPVVDLGTQMTDLVQAQMSYQANAEIMSDAKNAYAAILDIKA